MSNKWQIHRRTFLRGVGAAMALPMLDAMVPSLGSVVCAATGTAAKLPKRMAFVYVPNGVTDARVDARQRRRRISLHAHPRAAHAAQEGHHRPLRLRSDATASPCGDGAGDHARASASFLTGVAPAKDLRLATSAPASRVDQIAAEQDRRADRAPVARALLRRRPAARRVRLRLRCAYQFNLSWRSETMPVNAGGRSEAGLRAPLRRRQRRTSIRSRPARAGRCSRRAFSTSSATTRRQLQSRLGTNDRRKLDEYLTADPRDRKTRRAGAEDRAAPAGRHCARRRCSTASKSTSA